MRWPSNMTFAPQLHYFPKLTSHGYEGFCCHCSLLNRKATKRSVFQTLVRFFPTVELVTLLAFCDMLDEETVVKATADAVLVGPYVSSQN